MLTGQAKWREVMREPISRGEVSAMEERLVTNVGSTAAAIEALEEILVSKGILKDSELMEAVGALLERKAEQAKAAAATSPIIKGV